MKHLGLFEGIGGFSLAARWMGWETVAWSEINPFCRKVLSYHFPKAEQLGDIKNEDFTRYRGAIDIISGGFPCQPYSVAGLRKGKDDDRHLWPEMLRAIRECRPRWVVGENVRGLVSWDGGVVFNEVCADLEAAGYEVQPFLLPACAVDAPHKRERIWFVAHSKSQRNNGKEGNICKENGRQGGGMLSIANKPGDGHGGTQTIANTVREGFKVGLQPGERKNNRAHETLEGGKPARAYTKRGWREFPTQPPICSRNDGLSDRLDGITFPKWRNESIKAYGNAIVPQVALQIFKAIAEYETLHP